MNCSRRRLHKFSLGALLCALALLSTPFRASAYSLRYSYGLPLRWAYAGNKVVWYKLNTAYGPSETLSAIAGGMSAWNNVAGAALAFGVNAYSSAHQWGVCDGVNLIDFYPMDSESVIAANSIWYYTRSAAIIDSDIRFNLRQPFSTAGASGAFDLQTIATHELGHALMLDDLYGYSDSDKMMYGYGSRGQLKRQLHNDDKDGIVFLYLSTYVNYACLYAYYADCYAAAANNGQGNAYWAAQYSKAAYYWANRALSTRDAACSYYAWLCAYYAALHARAAHGETSNVYSYYAWYFGQFAAAYAYADYQGY